jgi:hypothetical protein
MQVKILLHPSLMKEYNIDGCEILRLFLEDHACRYQRVSRLFDTEDEGTIILRNVGNYLQVYLS